MGANGGHDGLMLPAQLHAMQEQAPVLLIFLRSFG
jgi:hypothetical protein